jgi:hypothetical protein
MKQAGQRGEAENEIPHSKDEACRSRRQRPSPQFGIKITNSPRGCGADSAKSLLCQRGMANWCGESSVAAAGCGGPPCCAMLGINLGEITCLN